MRYLNALNPPKRAPLAMPTQNPMVKPYFIFEKQLGCWFDAYIPPGTAGISKFYFCSFCLMTHTMSTFLYKLISCFNQKFTACQSYSYRFSDISSFWAKKEEVKRRKSRLTFEYNFMVIECTSASSWRISIRWHCHRVFIKHLKFWNVQIH